MKSPLNMLTKFVFPLLLIYLAYNSLGPVAGLVLFIIFLGLTVYSGRCWIFAARANKKYAQGDFDGALGDLAAAVAADPKSAAIRGNYAYLLLKLGHTEKAGAQIDIALKTAELPQDKASMTVTKALVLWKQNKVDEAAAILSNLLKTYETTDVYATLGFLYIAKGDQNEALEFNLKAKEYNSNNAIILDNLGTSYLLLEDYEKALEIYKEAMKLKPLFPEAYYNYGRALEKTGDLEKALYMVRHSLSLRFWNISTVKRETVEAYLRQLEEMEKANRPENMPEALPETQPEN